MQAPQPGRFLALALLPFLASLSACGNSGGDPSSAAKTVTTPAISPAGGTFSAAQTVTITDATPGASITYTLDGSPPASPVAISYKGPFTLSQSATVLAIAAIPGELDSAVTNATFLIPPPASAPTFTPPAGTYIGNQTISLSTSTPGAAIFYTINGTTPGTASTLYTGPITVSASETIEAIAVATGYSNSPVATAAYVLNLPQAAAPTFTPPAGTYTSYQYIVISDATPGAAIYYTTNGTTPTTASTLYTGPITVSTSQTIEAIAVAPSYSNSPVATAAYVLNLPQAAAPTFTPPAGTYTSDQYIVISDTTPGTAIYYTTNGTTPTTASTLYAGPITVSTSETIEAIAIAPGYSNSPIATAAYVLNLPQAAAPVFSPAAGTYNAAQSVTISETANNAAIYYTTNGTTPTTSSSLYSGPISVSTSETIQAIAVAPSYTNSPVATAAYTIQAPKLCSNEAPGIICTVAGDGGTGFSGDGGSATGAELNDAIGVGVDGNGNFYIADTNNNRVRKVTPAGIISTVAGTGLAGYSGDGGLATSAQLNAPYGVAADSSGNLYIADTGNASIRKVTPAGIISTVAGTGLCCFYSGDGGPATRAELNQPTGIAVDSSGNLYIADAGNNRIREVTAAGIITTVAGNGTAAFSGDGGPATSAEIRNPRFIALDNGGNLFISDLGNNRIRKVTPSGIITTVAGNGTEGFSGDGGPATSAEIAGPYGVAVDTTGNLFIADFSNNRVREVNPAGIMTTFAGIGPSYPLGGVTYFGDNGPAISAGVTPMGIAVDSSGNLYIACNVYIREVFSSIAAAPTFTPSAGTYAATQSVTISDTTPGASIYYTTDGSIPTSASSLYTGPITVSASETIHAIAVAPGYTNSPVAAAPFVL